MDVVLLARLQFGLITVYHFFFVPLTLGLSIFVAIAETAYVRTGDETYKRMTKFWGSLFLINFAMGVATGIVQEFQFGMNWAEYSRFVGDIFGVPLAIEALLAFFLESTFLGVWIFGWDRLSPRLHATAIWLVAVGSNLSALWILIANSFMQEPVGYVIRNGRAEVVETTLFEIKQMRQVLHIADFCNECGNCATFCVHNGRPYEDKPRLFLNWDDFEAEDDNAFYVTHDMALWVGYKRDGGRTLQLTIDWKLDHMVYQDENVRVSLDYDFDVLDIELKTEFAGRVSLTGAAETYTILKGLNNTLAFMPLPLRRTV
jgi:hypothetical protein